MDTREQIILKETEVLGTGFNKNNYESKRDYMQTQIGNPDGDDKPNKKNYDPRGWLRKGEESFVVRLKQAFEDLNCVGTNAAG